MTKVLVWMDWGVAGALLMVASHSSDWFSHSFEFKHLKIKCYFRRGSVDYVLAVICIAFRAWLLRRSANSFPKSMPTAIKNGAPIYAQLVKTRPGALRVASGAAVGSRNAYYDDPGDFGFHICCRNLIFRAQFRARLASGGRPKIIFRYQILKYARK